MTNDWQEKSIKRQQRRANFRKRSELVNAIAEMRYGFKILRALAVDALDIAQISAMTDGELMQLPGIGVGNVKDIRGLLLRYAEQDVPDAPPERSPPVYDVIPCGKGAMCNWPACPPSCLGRPGRGKT